MPSAGGRSWTKGRWPTKRVWVIAGNEPNLGREWGGEVDSASYAAYLSHFIDVFADSERFKVVNGPLDASNGSEMPKMQDAYEFLAGMEAAVPGSSRGWPAGRPIRTACPITATACGTPTGRTRPSSQAIGRDMPVLITEAGHLNTGDEHQIAAFYEQAFRDWMADPRVVAVTPLFWHPDRGVYWMFDFDQQQQGHRQEPDVSADPGDSRVCEAPRSLPRRSGTSRVPARPASRTRGQTTISARCCASPTRTVRVSGCVSSLLAKPGRSPWLRKAPSSRPLARPRCTPAELAARTHRGGRRRLDRRRLPGLRRVDRVTGLSAGVGEGTLGP